jgi:hypothetical protein
VTIAFLIPEGSSATDFQAIGEANEALTAMRTSRVDKIDAAQYIGSKIAWKLSTLRQPLLYRVVALAESFATNWNGQNIVGAYLPARALIETSALLLELEHELRALIEARDLVAIDALLMNRLFATRDAEWVAEQPAAKAISVLTLIDRLDRRDLPGIRPHYDEMSEICHPNSLGHRLAFGTLNQETGATTYSSGWSRSRIHSLFATMVLIVIAKDVFDALDLQVRQIASLQN